MFCYELKNQQEQQNRREKILEEIAIWAGMLLLNV